VERGWELSGGGEREGEGWERVVVLVEVAMRGVGSQESGREALSVICRAEWRRGRDLRKRYEYSPAEARALSSKLRRRGRAVTKTLMGTL